MSLSSETVKPALADFAVYARSLKGEAQLFLDRFSRALGHAGLQDAGATLEFRIAKKPGSAQLELLTGDAAAKDTPKPARGGKKFADLLWPDRALIEMKKRGGISKSTTTSFSIIGRGSCPSVRPTPSSATSTNSGCTTSTPDHESEL